MTKKTNQKKTPAKSKQSKSKLTAKLNKKFYFASANTCFGFVNYFNNIFNPQKLNKIYVIKGILGYGKSHKSYIINEIARIAADKNYSAECFYSPSDPDYLDGIIITDLNIAVVDGTNPHISDSKYPGIVEIIVNLGEFCDEAKLSDRKKEIFALTEKKDDCYNSAYKFLKAANELSEYASELAKKYTNEEKSDSAIKRILNRYVAVYADKNEYDSDSYRLINSVVPSGFYELDTLENDAKTIFYISNDNFSGFYYTKKLADKLSEIPGLSKIICPDALNPGRIRAVYICNSQTLFVIKNKSEDKIYGEKYNFINMDRFVSSDLKKEHKQKLKFIQKCYKSISEAASDCFKEIQALNYSIEDIYISAVDEEKQNLYTETIIKKIIQ